MTLVKHLKNDLTNTIQSNLSIFYFLKKIKNLYSKILLLDLDESIFYTQMKCYIIHDLKKNLLFKIP